MGLNISNMKKIILAALVVASLFASCSSEKTFIEVEWNERLKRLDYKFFNADKDFEVPFRLFVSRYKRIVVVGNKFDKK